jgi:2'-5' RNA ligase
MGKMYFIALVAPEEINRSVLEWKNFMKEHYGCVVALRSPAHITLIPPFWMDENLEKDLENALTEFSKQNGSFEILLKNFSAFKPRVIYISVEPNEKSQKLKTDLQRWLVNKTSFPIKEEDRPFHPHVSIATRDLHKKTFHEAWNIFEKKKYEASWQATGISLLKHNEKKWEVIFTSQLDYC